MKMKMPWISVFGLLISQLATASKAVHTLECFSHEQHEGKEAYVFNLFRAADDDEGPAARRFSKFIDRKNKKVSYYRIGIPSWADVDHSEITVYIGPDMELGGGVPDYNNGVLQGSTYKKPSGEVVKGMFSSWLSIEGVVVGLNMTCKAPQPKPR